MKCCKVCPPLPNFVHFPTLQTIPVKKPVKHRVTDSHMKPSAQFLTNKTSIMPIHAWIMRSSSKCSLQTHPCLWVSTDYWNFYWGIKAWLYLHWQSLSCFSHCFSQWKLGCYHYKNHRTTDDLCQKWCNPAPQDGSAPNLVVVEKDNHGRPYYKWAFNSQVWLYI